LPALSLAVHSHRDRTIRLPITTARTLITDPAAAESGTVTPGCLRANLSRWDPEVAKSRAERIAHSCYSYGGQKNRRNYGRRISIRGQLTPMEANIPKEAGATRPANNRTAYCRRQAAECHPVRAFRVSLSKRAGRLIQSAAALFAVDQPDSSPATSRFEGLSSAAWLPWQCSAYCIPSALGQRSQPNLSR
jgi:hypothetical protein